MSPKRASSRRDQVEEIGATSDDLTPTPPRYADDLKNTYQTDSLAPLAPEQAESNSTPNPDDKSSSEEQIFDTSTPAPDEGISEDPADPTTEEIQDSHTTEGKFSLFSLGSLWFIASFLLIFTILTHVIRTLGVIWHSSYWNSKLLTEVRPPFVDIPEDTTGLTLSYVINSRHVGYVESYNTVFVQPGINVLWPAFIFMAVAILLLFFLRIPKSSPNKLPWRVAFFTALTGVIGTLVIFLIFEYFLYLDTFSIFNNSYTYYQASVGILSFLVFLGVIVTFISIFNDSLWLRKTEKQLLEDYGDDSSTSHLLSDTLSDPINADEDSVPVESSEPSSNPAS